MWIGRGITSIPAHAMMRMVNDVSDESKMFIKLSFASNFEHKRHILFGFVRRQLLSSLAAAKARVVDIVTSFDMHELNTMPTTNTKK